MLSFPPCDKTSNLQKGGGGGGGAAAGPVESLFGGVAGNTLASPKPNDGKKLGEFKFFDDDALGGHLTGVSGHKSLRSARPASTFRVAFAYFHSTPPPPRLSLANLPRAALSRAQLLRRSWRRGGHRSGVVTFCLDPS